MGKVSQNRDFQPGFPGTPGFREHLPRVPRLHRQ